MTTGFEIDEDGRLPVRRIRFKLADKRGALVDLGKHLGMFRERVEVEHSGQVLLGFLTSTRSKVDEGWLRAKRPAGAPQVPPNKRTALIKDAIIEAATLAGGRGGLVGYLVKQANESPSSFMTLIGKVLPLQLTGADSKPLFPGEIDIRSLTDQQLTEFKKRLRIGT